MRADHDDSLGRIPAVSVLLSTYNSPGVLRLVLWGYAMQTEKDFEVVVADDGSTAETAELIAELRDLTGMAIQHVWQEDDGFRKNRILNRAIVAARADYLIIYDGDCIPRADFVAAHLKYRRPGCYLSGGYTKLPPLLSAAVTEELIQSGVCFTPRWLRSKGMRVGWRAKVHSRGWRAALLNGLTPTARKWNGHNASGWRADLLRINGYNEAMGYGAEGTELGYRLRFAGVRARQVRYHAVFLHLEHERPYRVSDVREANRAVTLETWRLRSTWTEQGIVASRDEPQG